MIGRLLSGQRMVRTLHFSCRVEVHLVVDGAPLVESIDEMLRQCDNELARHVGEDVFESAYLSRTQLVATSAMYSSMSSIIYTQNFKCQCYSVCDIVSMIRPPKLLARFFARQRNSGFPQINCLLEQIYWSGTYNRLFANFKFQVRFFCLNMQLMNLIWLSKKTQKTWTRNGQKSNRLYLSVW